MMNHEDRDTYGMYKPNPEKVNGPDMRRGPGPELMDADTVVGMSEKLFAVPWDALTLDTEHKRFVLDVEKDRLKKAPGFDRDKWPKLADPTWVSGIYDCYGTKPQTNTLRK